jgi:DNA-binding PadR family transcriptional regulator
MDKTKLTELEFTLLGLLVQGDSHPYRLARSAEKSHGGRVNLGGLYKALHRLEQAGLVESAWENVNPREAGRPRRRLYHLTANGGISFQRGLAARTTRLVSLQPWGATE